jgi:ankyrin repeat protein
VNFLLDRGANCEEVNDGARNRTPLIAAVNSGNVKLVELLVSRGANINLMVEEVSIRRHLFLSSQ